MNTQSPMAAANVTAGSGTGSIPLRFSLPLVAGGVLFLAAAWFAAQHQWLRGATAAELPFWKVVLTGMAFPWLLQWCGWVCLVCLVVRRFPAGVPAAKYGLGITVALGLVWWAGYFVSVGSGTILDGTIDLARLEVQLAWGSAPIWQTIWAAFLGPVLCPLRLRGPTGMDGWQFLTITLSTGIVASWWTLIFHWGLRVPAGRSPLVDYVKKLTLGWLPFFLLAVGKLLWQYFVRT